MDILVKIRDTYIPTDFVILDMGHNEEVPLLLGRPFLNTTNAVLHVLAFICKGKQWDAI
jgi:hypothetical protein